MPARQHMLLLLAVCCIFAYPPCLTAHKEAHITQLHVQPLPGMFGQDQAWRLEKGYRSAGQLGLTLDHTYDLHKTPIQWLTRRTSATQQQQDVTTKWLPNHQIKSTEEQKMLLKMPLLSIRNIHKEGEEGPALKTLSSNRHAVKGRGAPATSVESVRQPDIDGGHNHPDVGPQLRAEHIVNERGGPGASMQMVLIPSIRDREDGHEAAVHRFHGHFHDDDLPDEELLRSGTAAQWVDRVNREDEEDEKLYTLRQLHDDQERAEAEAWTTRKGTPVLNTRWWRSRGEEGYPGAPLVWMMQTQKHTEDNNGEDSGAPMQLGDRQVGADGADEGDEQRGAPVQRLNHRHMRDEEDSEQEESDASLQWIHRLNKGKKSEPYARLQWMQKRYSWYHQDDEEIHREVTQSGSALGHEHKERLPLKSWQRLNRYNDRGDEEVRIARQQPMYVASGDSKEGSPSESPHLLPKLTTQDVEPDASWQWVQRHTYKHNGQVGSSAQLTQKFLESIFKTKPSSDL